MADEDLRAELTKMMGPVQWDWLKPQVQRDVVVVVDPGLDLADVGVAIASDNTKTVERWITEQLIVKPSPEQLSLWSNENKRLTSLIVQPYVLVQDKLFSTGSEGASDESKTDGTGIDPVT